MSDPYLSVEELQDTLGATSNASRADYTLAVESASRWIDARCSDPDRGIVRHFWRDETPVARLFHADTPQMVRVGDFTDPAGLVVETDLSGSGTFTTLDSSLWAAEPVVRVNGEPFTRLVAVDYAHGFPLGLRPRVRVTAQWGWDAVPAPVVQACQILAVAYMLGKDVISNDDGYSLGSKGSTDPVALAEHLLRRYLPDMPVPAGG